MKDLKELIGKMDAKTARETLDRVLDTLDGNADGKLDKDQLQARVSAEVQRGATRALANPMRAIKVAAITGAICFMLGGVASYVAFC